MKPSKVLGIVGVTGLVGQTARELLETLKFKFHVKKLKAFASSASVGKVIYFNGQKISIEEPGLESLSECDAVLFACDAHLSRKFIPPLARKGIFCVDKSSAFRMDPTVPLIIPEVNANRMQTHENQYSNIIASPNCVAIPFVMVTRMVEMNFGLNRVILSTYQSVSGSGKSGMDVLLQETRDFLAAEDLTCRSSKVYPKSIAFNVMPFIESITEDNGKTGEEIKIIHETQKILNIPSLSIDVTSVRVPTFVGHAMSAVFETETQFEKNRFIESLKTQKGIKVTKSLDFITPREVQGKDEVFISRIRPSTAFQNGVSLWIACDNLRKGAALNALQIIEILLTRKV